MIEQLIGWAAFIALACLGGWSDHQAREHWLRRPYLRSTFHSSERPFNPALYRAPRTGSVVAANRCTVHNDGSTEVPVVVGLGGGMLFRLLVLAVVVSVGLCRGDSFYQLSSATISCSNDTSWQHGSVRGDNGFTAWVSGDGGCGCGPNDRSSDMLIDFSAYSFHEASADAFEALSGYDLSIGGFLSVTGPSINPPTDLSTEQSTVVVWSAFGGFIGLDGQAVNFSGSGSGVAYFEYYRGRLSNITWLLYGDIPVSSARSLVATPEPSSIILLILTIVCWAIVWRSRTSKNARAASIR